MGRPCAGPRTPCRGSRPAPESPYPSRGPRATARPRALPRRRGLLMPDHRRLPAGLLRGVDRLAVDEFAVQEIDREIGQTPTVVCSLLDVGGETREATWSARLVAQTAGHETLAGHTPRFSLIPTWLHPPRRSAPLSGRAWRTGWRGAPGSATTPLRDSVSSSRLGPAGDAWSRLALALLRGRRPLSIHCHTGSWPRRGAARSALLPRIPAIRTPASLSVHFPGKPLDRPGVQGSRGLGIARD